MKPDFDDGAKDIQAAWIWAVSSIAFVVFCVAPIFAPIALSYAKKAEQKGNANTKAPRVIAAAGVVLWILRLGLLVEIWKTQPHYDIPLPRALAA